ncbi:MAG: retropepsin-like domain-containing protein [Candidatus Eremiobacteraeota bacterium]|nr:retropepsin-like domain-containing protein [Candidatus Eremiobacteraeota bacterium]
MKRLLAVLAVVLAVAAPRAHADAEWQPPDLRPTTASRNDVLATYAEALGKPEPRYTQRREQWTYVNGTRHIPVQVTVRGDDFRASLDFGKGTYAGGRWDGVRWRADANGVAHATLSDDQGDAADRLPQSIFPFALTDCALAGESKQYPAWILADRPPRDKPHWFYVDKTSGFITREVTREGARTIVTAFDRFEALGGLQRARHWHVSDGNTANDLDVTVDALAPAALDPRDVAIPQEKRVFTFASPPPNGVAVLPATFRGRTIFVEAQLGGHRAQFILDTGTASITLDSDRAGRFGGTILEHATVPQLDVGPLRMRDVSVLSIPLGLGYPDLAGILGYDFFLGYVVHVDYEHQRVEVLTHEAADAAFRAPNTAVLDAYVDEGIPLVHAAFGEVAGDRFALDTGSQHLYALAPLKQRGAAEIAAHWTPANAAAIRDENYLEGSIALTPYRVAGFTLGPVTFTNLVVGLERPNDRPNAIDIALDGIVGTDEMQYYDWWFDYDNGRVAVRRNGFH